MAHKSSEQSLREAKLEAKLEEARATITGLAAKLTDERHAHRAEVEALRRRAEVGHGA